MTAFAFDNSFVRELPGFYVAWPPDPVSTPVLLYFNAALADRLGLALENCTSETLAALFSGKTLPDGAEPVAQVYAGHQFGHFSPRLGDGRALLLGEVKDRHGQRYDLGFKGSGRTPYSRNGDGKAAVGPMLREVLMGEGMQALGVPTTRALAVVASGQPVYRDRVLPGAILTRVANPTRCNAWPITPWPGTTRKPGWRITLIVNGWPVSPGDRPACWRSG
jgi:uncharacterized protein YdiU (UPF0061 family)